ncbi:MAG: P-II family nitrogen regulator [Halobacteriovoraceae bacterium]|jgi:nitrogen regulatory protein P-II 2|nr:P-II family nitrogen regulator [Halobacteriovoraceae bacterium]MBT5094991.1 P-II family nitrogen regulator [Halobacteriovoraceae bacterium]
MKLIIAYIRPDKVNNVKKLLYSNSVDRFSIIDAFGHSDEAHVMESYRGIEIEIDLLKKTRFEIAVNDAFVKPVVDALMEGGSSGEIGEGKVFVLPLEECYSISTGNSGSDAIG